MTKWEETKPSKLDELHAELRIACMRQDVRLITKLVVVDGIPIEAFNNLAMTVSKYHDKYISIHTLQWLRRVVSLIDES